MEGVRNMEGVRIENAAHAEQDAVRSMEARSLARMEQEARRLRVQANSLESQARIGATDDARALRTRAETARSQALRLEAEVRLLRRKLERNAASSSSFDRVLLVQDRDEDTRAVREGSMTPLEAQRPKLGLRVPSGMGRATLNTPADDELRVRAKAERLARERAARIARAEARELGAPKTKRKAEEVVTRRKVRVRAVGRQLDSSTEGSTDESDADDVNVDAASVVVVSRGGRGSGELGGVAQVVEGVETVEVQGRFRVPSSIYERLYAYQVTGVRWLWELHELGAGGIVGDEMGLGKTVQLVAFLAGLHVSGELRGPTLVLAPATTLRQWRREFTAWWPALRVGIAHSSDGGPGQRDSVVARVACGELDVVLSTYEGFLGLQERLVRQRWAYAVLDEGHKIRNPESLITLACKQLRTAHRVILTGSPIQNNLVELWSLFDFVFPGKLGTLPVFKTEFALPISHGGYASSSRAQARTAFECAQVLREQIRPFMLRRMKTDVRLQLPEKTERVLFCPLAPAQRAAYERYLRTDEVAGVLDGRVDVLAALTELRKICNHPLLARNGRRRQAPDVASLLAAAAATDIEHDSGKLRVLAQVLPAWVADGHRVLLFSQGVQMLDILEHFLMSRNLRHLRMDGSTPVRQRMSLVDSFNADTDVKVFLLTTRVGGVGLNLIGADRVLLFDPDWNPSVDAQARERSFRIGQTRDVVVYRLVSSGCVEERVFHRQVFKQYLTHKVLKDPRHRRFFKETDVRALIELDPETGPADTEVYFPDAIEDNADSDPDDSGEKRVIRALISDGGLHTVFDHDRVVDHGGLDSEVVRDEAHLIARRAASALRDSQRQCNDHSVNIPTWTGSRGLAGTLGTPIARRPSTPLGTPIAGRPSASLGTPIAGHPPSAPLETPIAGRPSARSKTITVRGEMFGLTRFPVVHVVEQKNPVRIRTGMEPPPSGLSSSLLDSLRARPTSVPSRRGYGDVGRVQEGEEGAAALASALVEFIQISGPDGPPTSQVASFIRENHSQVPAEVCRAVLHEIADMDSLKHWHLR